MQLDHLPFQDQLVRGLAHKMNNILTLFHGYVGLMLDNHELDQTTRANLSKIKEGACAASELIDRTHSLVHPPKIVSHEVELPVFLEFLRPVMQATCGGTVDLKIEVAGGTPNVETDAGTLRAALMELVKNAGEATATSGGMVRVEAGLAKEDPRASGPRVCLAVIDDGAGIAQEVMPRIFHPFFSTKRRKNSAGLGLNVATEAVQRLGGEVRYVPQAGTTRFEILLPVSRDA